MRHVGAATRRAQNQQPAYQTKKSVSDHIACLTFFHLFAKKFFSRRNQNNPAKQSPGNF
jgi:hypothetical protein